MNSQNFHCFSGMLVVWGNELLSERFLRRANCCFYTILSTSYLSPIGNLSIFGQRHNKFFLWKVIPFLATYCNVKQYFVSQIHLFRKTSTIRQLLLCSKRFPIVTQNLWTKSLFFFSAQKIIFNLTNRIYRSERTRNTVLMSEVERNFTTTREFFNQKFPIVSLLEIYLYNTSN